MLIKFLYVFSMYNRSKNGNQTYVRFEGAARHFHDSLLSGLQLNAGGFYLSFYEVYLWTILQ
ncbi:hypothetical protein ERIC1_1c23730 [Paenibacillus larvae subsp. larvae DSM 25719]|uniref:Uncharacterized protein n=1 Tax=Paenibacillus larvae subsp. larvae DSM 25430 TaxID=697284 RepID=V9WD15_9BACL|nr:hypothetical protein ERIC2_c39491 [Paenibacillus larvae subsp. larvae DSM 25430]ETK28880.1 hypothetical protein ERIC1_1c23730 [Paenibacillus larvae subsp. larvae DSM 25719]